MVTYGLSDVSDGLMAQGAPSGNFGGERDEREGGDQVGVHFAER